jgi:hypothetical protein
MTNLDIPERIPEEPEAVSLPKKEKEKTRSQTGRAASML